MTNNQIAVSLEAHSVAAPLDIILISYISKAETRVSRGENSGRVLKEFNVVRSMSVLGTYTGDSQQYTYSLSSLPPNVSGVVILAQRQKEGAIAAAASLTLRSAADRSPC